MKIEGDEIGLAIGTIDNSEVTTGMSIPYSLLVVRGAEEGRNDINIPKKIRR
jgi:hypothetical protein